MPKLLWPKLDDTDS